MLSRSKSKGSVCSEILWLSSIEHALNRFHQFLDPERLPDILNAGLRKESFSLVVHHISRHKQEAGLKLRIQRFDQPIQSLTAEARHALIADDHVVVLFLYLLERLHAAVGKIDSGTLARKDIEYELRDVDFIIDDKNLLAPQRMPLRRANRPDFFHFDFLPYRQFQRERGTASVGAPRVEFAPMVFYDFRANAQAETRAALLVLSGKERVEYAGHVARVNAAAVVGHGYLDKAGL